MEDPPTANEEVVKQEQEAPREANFEKVTMPNDEVPIVKTERNKTSCSLTTKRSKERLHEPNGEEEKKAVQDLA